MTKTETASNSVLPQSAPRKSTDHERHAQILQAAGERFRQYGYEKTTIGDIGKAVGVTGGYVYRFFDSKQAIGQAICQQGLSEILAELEKVLLETPSAVECLRYIYSRLGAKGAQLFFEDRKIYELVEISFTEKWPSVESYRAALLDVIRRVLVRGRESGEFERKTPIEEACDAIRLTMMPFYHPLLLVENLDRLDEKTAKVANLTLRSLAP